VENRAVGEEVAPVSISQEYALRLARRQQFAQFIEQAKGLDYKDWKPTVQFAEAKAKTKLFKQVKKGRLQYLHPGLVPQGSLQISFLQACQELNIPKEKWPQFGTVLVPSLRIRIEMPPFVPPPFEIITDTGEAWRKRANSAWSKYCKHCLPLVRQQINALAGANKVGANGTPVRFLIPQKQRRKSGKTSPPELRLKWAALHHCEGWSYGKIHADQKLNPKSYSLSRIIRAVQALLEELKLRPHS
jgi:hypothetical protein